MSNGRYAERTLVSPQKTRADIENLLERYGADGFAYAAEGDCALVAFRLKGRAIRFILPLPRLNDFAKTPSGATRTARQQESAHDQAVRTAWRALHLITKAKLEAVAAGITTLEREFLPDMVMPNGQTFGQFALPAVQRALESGEMPSMARALGTGKE